MKKVFLVIAAAAVFALPSCQKDNTSSVSKADAIQVAVDGDQASGIYADLGSEAERAASSLKDGGNEPDSTGSRRFEDHSKERKDGWFMKSLFFSKWGIGANKRWIKDGTVVFIQSPDKLIDTLKFVGIKVNGRRVEGMRVTTRSADGNTKVIKLIGGKITYKDSTTFTCDFTQTWTRTAGSDTPKFIWDDEWDITATSAGVTRKKGAYTEETTTPVHMLTAWPVFVSGEIKRVVGDKTIITNYGDGTKDFIITVTVNGVSTTVDLSQEDKK